MVLENVKEMWTEVPRLAGGKKGRPVNKDRFISKMSVLSNFGGNVMKQKIGRVAMVEIESGRSSIKQVLTVNRFLRGDTVILVLLS